MRASPTTNAILWRRRSSPAFAFGCNHGFLNQYPELFADDLHAFLEK